MQVVVGQQVERKVQPFGGLTLMLSRLARHPDDRRSTSREQVAVVIAEATGFRRASARTGDGVPPTRQRYAGRPGHGVDVDDDGASHASQIPLPARGTEKLDVREAATNKVGGASIVGRNRKSRWKVFEVATSSILESSS